MGQLRYIYDLDYDPTDPGNPNGTYSPYDFVPAGYRGVLNMSMGQDFARRESVVSIPSLDGVLDQNGFLPGPMDRREMPFSFRVFTNGDNDAAKDLLMQRIAPGDAMRLVYQTDAGALWYTIGWNPKLAHTQASANSWGHGGYVDFTVTWRIRPFWTPRYSETVEVWGQNDGVWGTSDGNWGDGETTPLNSNPTFFAVDATGVAGWNLPTIPDTGPTITIAGGTGGFGGSGTGAAAFPSMSGGTTGSVLQGNIVSGGSGYTNLPSVIFTGGTPTRPALAYAQVAPVIVAGATVWQVVGIVMVDGGAGYHSAPTISFLGGGQIVIANNSARVRDTTGVLRPVQVTIPWVPPGYSATLKCAAQLFSLAGATFRPIKANYQPYYAIVKNGIVNAWAVACQGPGAALVGNGASITVDWWRKRG